ncbi:ABC transporter permease [Facklamia sp. P12955]|uniref:ABC transporter permease n=1 Tax=unclassified Facklamia TaxID=2622293 RepID=UPI003D17DB3F
MKTYSAIFRIQFQSAIQYRTAALAGILTQFAWGLLLIKMFESFYQTNAQSQPMTFEQVCAYIWIQQAGLNLFALWIYDRTIFEEIISGNVAYQLTRPLGLYPHWFISNLAMRIARTLLRCLPMIIVASFLPEPYKLLPPNHLLLFIVTMILSTLLIIAFLMLVYISVFYFLTDVGIRVIVATIGEFLTGAIIPLPFLPQPLQTFIHWTPFAYMQNIPLRVYSLDISSWNIIIPQAFWLILLLVAGWWLMQHALSKFVIQGG